MPDPPPFSAGTYPDPTKKGPPKYVKELPSPTIARGITPNSEFHQLRRYHRSLSSCCGLLPGREDVTTPKLLDRTPSHPSGRVGRRVRVRWEPGDKTPSSVSDSTSERPGANEGPAPDPDPDADASTSSSLSSRYGSYLGLEGEPLARDRTTSPLQIGHVLRLVVSHGVLALC